MLHAASSAIREAKKLVQKSKIQWWQQKTREFFFSFKLDVKLYIVGLDLSPEINIWENPSFYFCQRTNSLVMLDANYSFAFCLWDDIIVAVKLFLSILLMQNIKSEILLVWSYNSWGVETWNQVKRHALRRTSKFKTSKQ